MLTASAQFHASVLAFLTIKLKSPAKGVLSLQLHAIVLLFFLVYAYQDILPLCTYTLSPVDGAEGWMLWTRVVILFLASVVIPMITPRVYVPIDPKVRAILRSAANEQRILIIEHVHFPESEFPKRAANRITVILPPVLISRSNRF